MPYERILRPGKIGPLELKNRVIMPAMATEFCAENGEVTDELIEWHARRSRGGAGLITVEACFAATAVDTLRTLPRSLRADDARFIPGLAALAGAIQRNGAKAAIQLTPGGGAQALGGPWTPGGPTEAVSPSGVPGLGHTDQPRSLSREEIAAVADWCGKSALNIKQAGFDLIEIHAHGGYLIAQFMSPYFNKRTDEYGGSLDNRCRFLLEIAMAIRKAVGPGFALTCKYSIEDFLPGGWDTEQSKFLAKKLEAAGIDAIGISSGVHGNKMPAVPPYFYAPGIFIPFAEAIKEAVRIPVILGGRLNDPDLAEKVLKENKADFLYEGRALIADPDWPMKVAAGQNRAIRPCLACNECRQNVIRHEPVRCAVNGVAGREREFDVISPSAAKKRVLVVGGGPGGLEAARVAALRGHEVILCERERHLGGLALLAGIHNDQVTLFVKWLVAELKKLPVEVRLKTEVTPALVNELKPDIVLLANGGTFVSPEVSGLDRPNVFSARDLLGLMNGVRPRKGILFDAIAPLARRAITPANINRFLGLVIKGRVAVIGGQFPGCSLALFLAHKGKKVTILESSAKYGTDMEAHTMVGLNNQIQDGNVNVITGVKLDAVNESGIVYTDSKGTKSLAECGTVITALELAPSQSELAGEISKQGRQVKVIGDAVSFGRIKKAVREGLESSFGL